MSLRPLHALAFLPLACLLASSCKARDPYKFDTASFVVAGPILPATGPEPNIHIDTRIKVSGLMGGKVESQKPYAIRIDYTDETFRFTGMEFTEVTVTYRDGTKDLGAAALKLPLRIDARPYEAVNSMAGGRIVKTKLRLVSGEIPGAINRDKPFTLRLVGKLIKDDGSTVPFAIERDYDVLTDTSTKPWEEVMQDR